MSDEVAGPDQSAGSAEGGAAVDQAGAAGQGASAAAVLDRGTGAGDGGAGGNAEGGTSPAWFEGLSADDKTYLAAKGWDKEGKGPADILKSYRNLERLRGVHADRLVKLPETEEEKLTFLNRIGVPGDPEAYETPELELNGEPVDGTLFKMMSHKLGHTPEQHAAFSTAVTELLESQAKEQAETILAQDTAEQIELDKDWGPNKDANYAAAGRAMQRLGLTAEDVDAIQGGHFGYKKTLELFARLGASMGEGAAPANDKMADPGPMGASTAKARLDALLADKGFVQRIKNGDVAAVEQYESLKRVAFRS